LAYAAKCNTASHSKWWITGTGSVVNRLSEAMDDNPAGVEENDNPGNFQPWAEFMTEHVEDGMYQIHQNFDVGDGSTSTTLNSELEFVWFDDGKQPKIKVNATLNQGSINNSAPSKGAAWRWQADANAQNWVEGTYNCYSGLLQIGTSGNGNGPEVVAGAVADFERVILNPESHTQFQFYQASTGASYKHMYIAGGRVPWVIQATPSVFENCVGGDADRRSLTVSSNDATVSDYDWYSYNGAAAAYGAIYAYNANAMMINPVKPIVPEIGTAHDIYEQRTINIEVVDQDGVALETAAVLLEDDADVDIFDVTTDAGGDIAEQTMTPKSWTGTDETEDDNNPFKLTIFKAGYETLILENITIDSSIKWRLELQSQKQPPAPWQEGMM